MSRQLTPLYRHHCDRCVFISRTMGHQIYDWYVHLTIEGKPYDVVARYADELPCYNSYLVHTIDSSDHAIGMNIPNNVRGEFEQLLLAREMLRRFRNRPLLG